MGAIMSEAPASEIMEESPEFTRVMVQSFLKHVDATTKSIPSDDGVCRAYLVHYSDFRPVAGTALERVFKSGGDL